MTFIIRPRTKKQEAVLKAFLHRHSIAFHSEAQEEKALYNAMEKGRKSALLTKAEKSAFIKRLKKAS